MIHLHVHTHYSLLDGLASPSELADRAIELKQVAIGITDHGNMYGAIDFFASCKERGIKPIIGIEAYVAPNSRHDKTSKKGDIVYNHLTLLAKNIHGYYNLMQLATLGYTEGFYYKPRIDMETIKQYHEGVVCLSGCLYSTLSRGILSHNFDVLGYCGTMRDIFGDDFYIEIQNHGLPEQKEICDYMMNSNIPSHRMVVSNDVHYVKQEDYKAHDALLCIGHGTNIYEKQRVKFECDDLWLKSEEELQLLFPQEMIDRTHEVADKCQVEIPLHKIVHIHNPETAYLKIKEICDEKIKQYDNKYKIRYNIEMDAIQRTGYSEYILVVYDFITYCRYSNIVVGSGRGSSAGSLVCYLLGITKIDPILYGLLFERFINIERVEPPDIDVDISQERRLEVIEYLKNEYGKDHVAQIVAFGSMKTKLVIKDVCRVLQIEYGIGERICKIIGEHYDGTIDDVFNDEKLNPMYTVGMNKEVATTLHSITKRIEGRLRNESTHAAGVVISDVPLTNNTPLCVVKNNILTQYDMYAIEKLGLLKFDILGLRTLDVIHDACEYLKINSDNIPLDNAYTYTQIRRGETFGIFQYEGYGYTKFIKKMQPQNFDHLIALGAIYRPGPLNSGMAEEFLSAMHSGYSSSLDEITADTYGILLYQEQVMQAAVKYAGFTMNEADTLRKAIGKKDDKLMTMVLDTLSSKMRQLGHDMMFINQLIFKITKFARYGWNKAHAVSYAILSYQTAYLKFNYPTEYFCALLNSEIGDNDRIKEIIQEAIRWTVKISPPNINISDTKFRLHNDTIYGGLMALKGIGEKTCMAIIEERNRHGRFTSASDLRARIPPKNLNSVAMKVLIEGNVI